MDLCTCYFRINKIRPKATTNTEIHNKPCESCDMFDDKRLYLVRVVSHWQSLSYSLASICHACFQSKSITASSPDKYMSMAFSESLIPVHVQLFAKTTLVLMRLRNLMCTYRLVAAAICKPLYPLDNRFWFSTHLQYE